MSETNKRIFYYDIIRTLACFLVILVHTYTLTLTRTFNNIHHGTYAITTAIFAFSKICVPLFIMISGTLMLSKDESIETILKKRVVKFSIILVIWSFIFYVLTLKAKFDFIDFIKTIVIEPKNLAFWYLYAIIGLYIISPFIRKIIKYSSKKELDYFLLVWVIVASVLPVIEVIFKIQFYSYIRIFFFNTYLGYFILGYYLDKYIMRSLKVLIMTLLASLIISVTLTITYSLKLHKMSQFFMDYNQLTTILMAASSFIIIKVISARLENNAVLKKSISFISRNSLGVYLIHNLIIAKTYDWVKIKIKLYNGYFDNLQMFLYAVMIFIISLLITWVISKIKYIKYIVR